MTGTELTGATAYRGGTLDGAAMYSDAVKLGCAVRAGTRTVPSARQGGRVEPARVEPCPGAVCASRS